MKNRVSFVEVEIRRLLTSPSTALSIDIMDNKKQKQQHQDDADRISDKKEVTDHDKNATSSTSSQRQVVYHPIILLFFIHPSIFKTCVYSK